ncbi:pH regulation protein F [Clostridiales bacterium COT073_COT-073]|nr:pH regulation protein F [Clostridiales bacterium COT073_COT-073]
MLNFFLFALVLSGLFHVIKIIVGPSIWDRLLGFNLFSLHIVLIILIYAAMTGLHYLIDIALVYALLGFISIIFIARYVKRGGNV